MVSSRLMCKSPRTMLLTIKIGLCPTTFALPRIDATVHMWQQTPLLQRECALKKQIPIPIDYLTYIIPDLKPQKRKLANITILGNLFPQNELLPFHKLVEISNLPNSEIFTYLWIKSLCCRLCPASLIFMSPAIYNFLKGISCKLRGISLFYHHLTTIELWTKIMFMTKWERNVPRPFAEEEWRQSFLHTLHPTVPHTGFYNWKPSTSGTWYPTNFPKYTLPPSPYVGDFMMNHGPYYISCGIGGLVNNFGNQ